MAETKKTPLMIIFVTVFIDLLGFGIVLPLLPRYAKTFDAGKWELGALMASFSVMQFLFAPIWGRVSDRVGRRPILLLGLAGSTISYALFGYASGLGEDGQLFGLGILTWLFMTRIGAGIAGATIPTAQAYIADTTGRADRTKGMALIGAAFGIGFTFGPLIGAAFVDTGWLVELMSFAGLVLKSYTGWEFNWWLSLQEYLQAVNSSGAPNPHAGYAAAALSATAFLWALFKLPESLKPGESLSAGESHLKNLGSAFRDGAIGILLLAIFLTTFAFAQFESTLSLLTQALGESDRDNFLLFAYVGLILTLSQGMIIRRLATRVPPQKLALGGTAVMIIGLGLIGLAGKNGSTEQLYWFLPIAVIGFSAVTPSLQSLLSLRTSPDRQGEVLGTGQSMSALARILGPVAGMRLFDEAHVEWPYWMGAGLMLVGLVLVAQIRGTGDGPAASEPDDGVQPVSDAT